MIAEARRSEGGGGGEEGGKNAFLSSPLVCLSTFFSNICRLVII